MWYAGRHETSNLCAPAQRRGADGAGEGFALRGRICLTPLPDPLGQCRGDRAPCIAAYLGIDDQTVLDALHAFNGDGLKCLTRGSSRPKRTRLVFGPNQAERLRGLLHRSPRAFDQPTSVWTLELAAEVSCA